MTRSLGVKPEALFDFVLSPYDEKMMNALPSPNILIATPGSATNASAKSEVAH
jgi:hypothetical protein